MSRPSEFFLNIDYCRISVTCATFQEAVDGLQFDLNRTRISFAEELFLAQEAEYLLTRINSLGDCVFEIDKIEARTHHETPMDRNKPVFWVVLKTNDRAGMNRVYATRRFTLAAAGIWVFAKQPAGFYGSIKLEARTDRDVTLRTLTRMSPIPSRVSAAAKSGSVYLVQFLLFRTPAADPTLFDERKKKAELILREAKRLVGGLGIGAVSLVTIGGSASEAVETVEHDGLYANEGDDEDRYGVHIKDWFLKGVVSTTAPLRDDLIELMVSGSGRKRQISANTELTVVRPTLAKKKWNRVDSSPEPAYGYETGNAVAGPSNTHAEEDIVPVEAAAIDEEAETPVEVTENAEQVVSINEEDQDPIAVTENNEEVVTIIEEIQAPIAVTETVEEIVAIDEQMQDPIIVADSVEEVVEVEEEVQALVAVAGNVEEVDDIKAQLILTRTMIASRKDSLRRELLELEAKRLRLEAEAASHETFLSAIDSQLRDL